MEILFSKKNVVHKVNVRRILYYQVMPQTETNGIFLSLMYLSLQLGNSKLNSNNCRIFNNREVCCFFNWLLPYLNLSRLYFLWSKIRSAVTILGRWCTFEADPYSWTNYLWNQTLRRSLQCILNDASVLMGLNGCSGSRILYLHGYVDGTLEWKIVVPLYCTRWRWQHVKLIWWHNYRMYCKLGGESVCTIVLNN